MPLEALERVVKLSPLVLRVLGHNPGSFSLQGSNLYVVGSGRSRILVDAGEGMEEDLPTVLKAMAADGADRLSDVLITHYHRDHTEGIKGLRALYGDALRVWKLPWTAPDILMPWHKVDHGPSFDLAEMGVRILSDGDVLRAEDGSATLRALATPGHTVDHCCFVLEEEGALFSGDHVLGGSSGVFDDLYTYMRSLDKALAELPEGGGGRIYPGHGPVIEDGRAGVCEYIANRRQRERQVVAALQGRRLGLTPFGLVRRIYPQLSLALTLAASSNVDKTLRKLQAEGRAAAIELSPCAIRVFGVGLDWVLLKRWYLCEPGEAGSSRGSVARVGAAGAAAAAALAVVFAVRSRL